MEPYRLRDCTSLSNVTQHFFVQLHQGQVPDLRKTLGQQIWKKKRASPRKKLGPFWIVGLKAFVLDLRLFDAGKKFQTYSPKWWFFMVIYHGRIRCQRNSNLSNQAELQVLVPFSPVCCGANSAHQIKMSSSFASFFSFSIFL